MPVKPAHYCDMLDMFAAYRSAKYLMQTPFNENMLTKYGLDINRIKQSYAKAENITNMIDKTMIQLQTQVDGWKLYKILYYRYLIETPLSEENIMARLSYEGIAKSRQTYQRLKEKAISIACAYLWNTEINEPSLKDVKTPNISVT